MRLIDADKISVDFAEILERDYADDYAKGFRAALVAVLKYEAIAPPPNGPLALEELREMDGEPVWVVDGDCGYYALIGCVYETCIWITSRYDADYCLMFSGYGADWLAYRRRPEEGTT